VILLLAFALRLYRLGYQSIWYDEAVSIHLAAKDLGALTLHTARDIHPPLYYYLLHFWVRAAGTSEFSVAFFSLVFGVLIVALAYRLGHRICGRRVGLLTAFLIAVSPFNLWYSQEMRMYTLGALLGLLTLYCLMRLLGLWGRTPEAKGAERRFWMGYVLAAAAGLYSLYYFAFLLLFENLFVLAWWLWNRLSRREQPLSLARWLLAQVLVLALYLPWLPIALRQALFPPVPPWRAFSSLATVITESWAALSLGQSVEPESLLIWPVLSLSFAIYLLGVAGRGPGPKHWPTSLLLCGYTFVPVLVIYLLSLRTPLFHVRYVFTYSPPFYLLLAMGLVRMGNRWRVAVPLVLAVVVAASGLSVHAYHTSPQYAADDHRAAVGYVEDRVAPGDAVLINAGYAYPAFLYYYQGDIAWRGRLVDYQPEQVTEQGVVLLQTGTVGGDEGLGWGHPDSDFYATSETETAEALERVFAHHPRVWVYRIYDTVTDPEGFIRSWLEEHGRLVGEEDFVGEAYLRVSCYLTHTGPEYDGELVHHSLGLDLGHGLRLLGYEGPAMVRSGEELSLTLLWQASQELETSLDVRVSFAVEDGFRVADAESTILPEMLKETGELVSQEIRLPVPPGTAPLDYDLLLELSDSLEPSGVIVPVGTIRVLRPLIPLSTPSMPHEPWANFGDTLQLTGYAIEGSEVRAGGQVRGELLWRAWDTPLPPMEAEVVLTNAAGETLVSTKASYPGAAYPSTLWEREELVRELYLVEVPESASPGLYELSVVLRARTSSGAWEVVPVWSPANRWDEAFDLARVEVTP
jgi:mannosyltransferase